MSLPQRSIRRRGSLTAAREAAHPAAYERRADKLRRTPTRPSASIAFTDAVMAVAITLLVLDLKLPEGLSDDDLFAAIPALSHALWCYVLSFIVIGVLWMAHHNQFAHIRRVDGALLWLNLFFLMAVALIPFVDQRHERAPQRAADHALCRRADDHLPAVGRHVVAMRAATRADAATCRRPAPCRR